MQNYMNGEKVDEKMMSMIMQKVGSFKDLKALTEGLKELMSGQGNNHGKDDMMGGLVQKMLEAVMEDFGKIDPKELNMEKVTSFVKNYMVDSKVDEKTISKVMKILSSAISLEDFGQQLKKFMGGQGNNHGGDDMLGGLLEKMLKAVTDNFSKIDPRELNMEKVTSFMKEYMVG